MAHIVLCLILLNPIFKVLEIVNFEWQKFNNITIFKFRVKLNIDISVKLMYGVRSKHRNDRSIRRVLRPQRCILGYGKRPQGIAGTGWQQYINQIILAACYVLRYGVNKDDVKLWTLIAILSYLYASISIYFY